MLARPKGAATHEFAATARDGGGAGGAGCRCACWPPQSAGPAGQCPVPRRGRRRRRVPSNGTCTSSPRAGSGSGWRSRPGARSSAIRPACRRSRWSEPGTATRWSRVAACARLSTSMRGPTGRLTLPGQLLGYRWGSYEAVLLRRSSTQQHVVPVQRDGDRFTIEINAAAMPSFGRLLPLRDGSWDLFLRRERAADGELIVPGYDHSRLGDLDGRKLSVGQKTYRFTTAGYDTPMLMVGPALKLTEHGRVQRRMLRGVYYPLQQKLPLRDAVVFISWKGKQCADNPPRDSARNCAAAATTVSTSGRCADWSVPAPDGARTVLTGTEDYFEALGRSRYVIANDDMQAELPQAGGPVLRADLARHSAQADRLRHRAAPVHQRHRLLRPAGARRRASGTCCCRPTRSARRSCAARSGSTARCSSRGTRATTCCAAAAPTASPRRSGGGSACPTASASCCTRRPGGTTSTTHRAGTGSTSGSTSSGPGRNSATTT